MSIMINVWEKQECLIAVVGVLKNKMKYPCSKCNFHWVGTSYTFDEVREHEDSFEKE